MMPFDMVECTSEEPQAYGEQFRDPGRVACRQARPRILKKQSPGAYDRYPRHSRMIQLRTHPASRGLDHLCSLTEKIIFLRPHSRLTLENGSQRTINIALNRMSQAR
jgi:hypothetical protein